MIDDAYTDPAAEALGKVMARMVDRMVETAVLGGVTSSPLYAYAIDGGKHFPMGMIQDVVMRYGVDTDHAMRNRLISAGDSMTLLGQQCGKTALTMARFNMALAVKHYRILRLLGFLPSKAYAIVGKPFARLRHGKKRWALYVKHLRRGELP